MIRHHESVINFRRSKKFRSKCLKYLICVYDVIDYVVISQQVNWHDLAFFDPILFESLRQLVVDAESGADDVIKPLDLTFMVDLQSEEGGGQVSVDWQR